MRGHVTCDVAFFVVVKQYKYSYRQHVPVCDFHVMLVNVQNVKCSSKQQWSIILIVYVGSNW